MGTGGVSAGGVSASGASSASVGGVLVLVEDILDLGLDFVDDARHVCASKAVQSSPLHWPLGLPTQLISWDQVSSLIPSPRSARRG